MAVTRKSLKAMGIEDEKIDQIIEDHRETVDGIKRELEEAKAQADEYMAQADKVGELQKELEDLRAIDPDARYNAEHEAFEAFKAQVETEKAEAEKKDLYKAVLAQEKVDPKRIDAILRVTDLDSFTVKDGAIEEADKLAEAVRKEWADFIREEQTVGAGVQTPPNKSYSQEDLASLSMSEYIAARQNKS